MLENAACLKTYGISSGITSLYADDKNSLYQHRSGNK
jgi:hypothetical protein